MQNLARKMTTAMTYPGAFFRYQSKPLRSFYHALSRAAHHADLPVHHAFCLRDAVELAQERLSASLKRPKHVFVGA